MIVYNVKRRWFTEKALAEAYRKVEGLKPDATVKLEVKTREDLAALLNALCEPLPKLANEEHPVAQVITRAFVAPDLNVPDYVPLFLISDPKQREEARLRLMEKNDGPERTDD